MAVKQRDTTAFYALGTPQQTTAQQKDRNSAIRKRDDAKIIHYYTFTMSHYYPPTICLSSHPLRLYLQPIYSPCQLPRSSFCNTETSASFYNNRALHSFQHRSTAGTAHSPLVHFAGTSAAPAVAAADLEQE